MKLTHACIVTNDMDGLCGFYARVLGVEGNRFGEYAEFESKGATLALCSRTLMEQILPGEAEERANRSLQLELAVDSADDAYRRLRELDAHELKEPVDYPWGLRACYFRDPDGNVLGFYSPSAGASS